MSTWVKNSKPPRNGLYVTYIIEGETSKLYVGQTKNLPRRIYEHCFGPLSKAPTYLGVARILRVEHFTTREEVLAKEREYQNSIESGWIPDELPCSFMEPTEMAQFSTRGRNYLAKLRRMG